MKAAKAGDKAQLYAANGKWQVNGNDIAVFLSGANPKHWPEAIMMHEHMLHFADTLSSGIQGQFPDKFK